MTTPKRRGRAVSAGREYRAGGSAASGQTLHNCAWISSVLSPPTIWPLRLPEGPFRPGLYGTDSPLEEDGFEPSVPPRRNSPRARHVVSAHGAASSDRHSPSRVAAAPICGHHRGPRRRLTDCSNIRTYWITV